MNAKKAAERLGYTVLRVYNVDRVRAITQVGIMVEVNSLGCVRRIEA